MMKTYIGVKVVQAEPETRDGKEGYKVVYSEPDKPDYTSWCPADVFERHNRETQGLPFSLALEACKTGKKITRKGWNGKGMYVVYKPGYPQGINCNAVTAKAHGIEEGAKIYVRSYLELWTVDGMIVPWLASQTDMLCDDWFIVE